MTMRFEKRFKIGDVGAVYEFDVKLPPLHPHTPLLSQAQLEADTEGAVEEFAETLRRRYKWVGAVYLTGRSGGWLAITDQKGGATRRTLETIDGLVDKAYEQFIKGLKETYGKLHLTPGTDPGFKKRCEFFKEHVPYSHSKETVVSLARAEEAAEELGWETEWDEDLDGADTLGDIDPATVTEILVAVLKDQDGEVLGSLGGVLDPDQNYRRVIEAEIALEALQEKGLL